MARKRIRKDHAQCLMGLQRVADLDHCRMFASRNRLHCWKWETREGGFRDHSVTLHFVPVGLSGFYELRSRNADDIVQVLTKSRYLPSFSIYR